MTSLVIFLALQATALAICMPDGPYDDSYNYERQYRSYDRELRGFDDDDEYYSKYDEYPLEYYREGRYHKKHHHGHCYPNMPYQIFQSRFFDEDDDDQSNVWEHMYSKKYLEYLQRLHNEQGVGHLYGLNGEHLYGRNWNGWNEVYTPEYLEFLEHKYGKDFYKTIRFGQAKFLSKPNKHHGKYGHKYYDHSYNLFDGINHHMNGFLDYVTGRPHGYQHYRPHYPWNIHSHREHYPLQTRFSDDENENSHEIKNVVESESEIFGDRFDAGDNTNDKEVIKGEIKGEIKEKIKVDDSGTKKQTNIKVETTDKKKKYSFTFLRRRKY